MAVWDSGNDLAERNGEIYVVGGCTGDSTCTMVSQVLAYDAATDTWSSLPDLAIARTAGGAAVINGILYAVGGYDNVTFHEDVDAYNIGIQPTVTPTSTNTPTVTPTYTPVYVNTPTYTPTPTATIDVSQLPEPSTRAPRRMERRGGRHRT